MTNKRKVVQVIGTVVDVEFPPGQLPNIFYALEAEIEIVDLVQALDVSLKKHDASRPDMPQDVSRFGIGLKSLKADKEQLTDFFFQCESRDVFHALSTDSSPAARMPGF